MNTKTQNNEQGKTIPYRTIKNTVNTLVVLQILCLLPEVKADICKQFNLQIIVFNFPLPLLIIPHLKIIRINFVAITRALIGCVAILQEVAHFQLSVERNVVFALVLHY